MDTVARDLIGRTLRVSTAEGHTLVCIVETEAYGDSTDAASHAAFRPGGNAAIMFGPAGSVYVYAAYGMYPCFNIVTGPEGNPSAVLLRGVWRDGDQKPTFGPGRTSLLLGITLDDQGEFLPGARFGIGIDRHTFSVECTERIGIKRAVETRWRFVAAIEP